jgi:O-antigen/teichoic acid export membrane protein
MKKILDFKFLKEAGLLGSSNLFNAASNGLIIVLLNKYLLAEQAGVFLYLLAIASPLFIFFGFDLRRKVTINQLDGLSLNEVFSLRNSLSLISMFFFIVISFILSKYSLVVLVALIAIGIGKIFDTVTETNYAIYQHHNQEEKIIFSRFLKFILSFSAFLIGSNNNYLTIFSLYAMLNILPFFLLDIKIIKKLEPSISLTNLSVNYEKAKRFIVENLNLAVGSLIMVVTPNVPTYFIKYFLDYSSVTYFTSVNFILQAIYVGGGAGLGYAMLKKFRNAEGGNLSAHIPLLGKASVMSLVTYSLFGFLFFYLNGLVLLFGSQYAGIYPLFFILLYSGYFFTVSSFLNNFLLFCEKKSLVLKLRFVRIALIISLCFVFPNVTSGINSFGYALVVTNFVDCVLHVIFIYRLLYKKSVKVVTNKLY